MTTTPLVYRYVAEDPARVGWIPAFKNSFDQVLVPARLVPADYKQPENPDDRPGISEKPKHVFETGKVFRVVENSELHEFVRTNMNFRKVLSNELRVGPGGEVTLLENPDPPKIPVNTCGDRPVNEDDEVTVFGGASNSSWSALEEQSSAKLMRHAEIRGKRAGNSP
jgi:hypothetical protein